MRTELCGLKGGKKQQWLRLHRAEVLTYYKQHGEAATKEYFNIVKPQAWEKILATPLQAEQKYNESDKAMMVAEIAREAANEARAEVRSLKEQYGQFCEIVADTIGKRILLPVLKEAIHLPKELELRSPRADSLDITDLSDKSALAGRQGRGSYVMSRKTNK